MRHAMAFMLEQDAIIHIELVAENLSRTRGYKVSRAEAVEYLVKTHKKKVVRKMRAKDTKALTAGLQRV